MLEMDCFFFLSTIKANYIKNQGDNISVTNNKEQYRYNIHSLGILKK